MLKKHGDIGELLSTQHAQQKAVNRAYLTKVLQNIILLARQGLPLRGRWIPSDEESSASEKGSNFYQLLLLRSQDDASITEILRRKTHKYTDHNIHNELLKILALGHLRTIASKIREAGFFTLLSDEVTDSSNKEQIIVCLRWVDSKFVAYEDFIGLRHVDDITTDTVVRVLTDTILRMNLKMSMCRAQCYDQRLFILRTRDRKLRTVIIYDVYIMYWAFDEHLKPCCCNGCSCSQTRKVRVLLYFAYLEGDSLTFPHPCVLHDRVLLSIRE